MTFQPVRGTRDIFGIEKLQQVGLITQARQTAFAYNYQEIETPIFEDTRVFHRLGETSDIVSKETYTFQDRGGDSITLRPEGTAPVVRALISNGLTQSLPGKYFYWGPMFRYDRPQKGRFRQFYQIGIEHVGVPSYLADLDVLDLACTFLDQIGVLPLVTLELNTLGDMESRQRYRNMLVDYLTPYAAALSEDSQRRLTQNPLRILDSKDPKDQEIVKGAPAYELALSPEARHFFDNLLKGLDSLGIAYQVNNKLVRGLDYYCHTAFEFTTDRLGAQATVLGGGRYDGLFAQMGGPSLPGVGWAAGVDRLMLLSQLPVAMPRPVVVLPLSFEEELLAMHIAQHLRQAAIPTEVMVTPAALGKRLTKANKMSASFALILGEDEKRTQHVQVKNLDAGTEEKIAFDQLVPYIQTRQP